LTAIQSACVVCAAATVAASDPSVIDLIAAPLAARAS